MDDVRNRKLAGGCESKAVKAIFGFLLTGIPIPDTSIAATAYLASQAGSGSSHSTGSNIIVFIFGWPLIFLATAALISGLLLKNSKLIYAGAVLSVPFSLYLAAAPLFSYAPLALPFMLASSGLCLKKKKHLWPIILILPWVGAVIYLGFAVLIQ